MHDRQTSPWLHGVIDALLLALPLLASTAWAQSGRELRPDLEVLNAQGTGIPLAPYLSELVSGDARARGSVMPRLVFPIRTLLRSGYLEGEGVPALNARWLVQPMFLVGADARSLAWLDFNRHRLAEMRATGIVVQAADAAAFRSVQAVAPALSYAPASGDWLDRQLLRAGVTVFPVLIDSQGKAWQRLGALSGDPAPVGMPWRRHTP